MNTPALKHDSLARFRLKLIAGFLPILVLCILAHYYQHRSQQLATANQIVENVHNSIQHELLEKHHLLDIFAERNADLLSHIIKDPENIHLLSDLHINIRDFFPDNFAISISDSQGNILLNDFDGKIGDICRSDLKEYARTAIKSLRIHPNPATYHYDVVTDWKENEKEYLLFASFNSDELVNILKSQQLLGHELVIVIKSMKNLIEVTPLGDRSNLKNTSDFNLPTNILDSVIAEKNITNSQWTILAILDEKVYLKKKLGYLLFYTLLLLFYISFIIFITQQRHTTRTQQ